MPNLAELLSRSAAVRPDRVAVKLDDSELSYAALDEAAARAAGLLRAKGVQPGDRVAIMLPNVAYFAICYYGALRAGAAVVTMNGLLKEREVAFHLDDSGAKLLLAWTCSVFQRPDHCPPIASALIHNAWISTGLPIRGVITQSPTLASIHVSCTPGAPALTSPSAPTAMR